jgi:hypothetical protein
MHHRAVVVAAAVEMDTKEAMMMMIEGDHDPSQEVAVAMEEVAVATAVTEVATTVVMLMVLGRVVPLLEMAAVTLSVEVLQVVQQLATIVVMATRIMAIMTSVKYPKETRYRHITTNCIASTPSGISSTSRRRVLLVFRITRS